MIIVVLLDGVYDEKCKYLGYKTPLQVADLAGMRKFEKNAKYFTVRTSYDSLPIGSIIANMGLLGYDPRVYHYAGRAIYEVLARKNLTDIKENDLIMRLNYVALDEKLNLVDFTGGQIRDDIAIELTKYLNDIYREKDYEIVHGKSYRNTIIIRDSALKYSDFISFEPHMNRNRSINELLLKPSQDLNYEKMDELVELNRAIVESKEIIEDFMKDKYSDCKADSISLWGQSYIKAIPKLSEINAGIKRGIIISGSDFLVGIGKMGEIESYTQPSFTGEIDTDVKGKFLKAKTSIENGHDLVYLHINALDEAAHILDPVLKKELLEKIDKEVLVPLYKLVKDREDAFVVILGDHYTSSITGKHLATDIPALVYNKKFNANSIHFDENVSGEKVESYELLKKVCSNGKIPKNKRVLGAYLQGHKQGWVSSRVRRCKGLEKKL